MFFIEISWISNPHRTEFERMLWIERCGCLRRLWTVVGTKLEIASWIRNDAVVCATYELPLQLNCNFPAEFEMILWIEDAIYELSLQLNCTLPAEFEMILWIGDAIYELSLELNCNLPAARNWETLGQKNVNEAKHPAVPQAAKCEHSIFIKWTLRRKRNSEEMYMALLHDLI